MAFKDLIKGANELRRGVDNATSTARSAQRSANEIGRIKSDMDRKKEARDRQKQEAATWTCACGAKNTSKFCASCGAGAPVAVKCKKCGKVRSPKEASQKFCPECGTQYE